MFRLARLFRPLAGLSAFGTVRERDPGAQCSVPQSLSRSRLNRGFVRVVGMFPELQFLVKGFISSFSAVFWGSILMWVAACLNESHVACRQSDSRDGIAANQGYPHVGNHRSLLDSPCEPKHHEREGRRFMRSGMPRMGFCVVFSSLLALQVERKLQAFFVFLACFRPIRVISGHPASFIGLGVAKLFVIQVITLCQTVVFGDSWGATAIETETE